MQTLNAMDPRQDPSQNPRDPGVGNDPSTNPAEEPADPSILPHRPPLKPETN